MRSVVSLPGDTAGGLFSRVRLEHMDREGIDHQV
jgi:hypothetical protein